MICTFSSNGLMPCLSTWCPRKLRISTPNTHLDGLMTTPYSDTVWTGFAGVRHVPLVCHWQSRGHRCMHNECESSVTSSIKRWNVWAALRSPNGIRTNSNRPKGVVIAVLGTSSGCTGIWWYALTRSSFVNICLPSKRDVKSCRGVSDIDLEQFYRLALCNRHMVSNLLEFSLQPCVKEKTNYCLKGELFQDPACDQILSWLCSGDQQLRRRGRAATGGPWVTMWCLTECFTPVWLYTGRVTPENHEEWHDMVNCRLVVRT